MRVVGGKWGGRPLEAPVGRGVTRPTTDRTREAVASMILSAFGLDLSEVSVLDAFAGSGAMGIELLSRGAARCTFCERDRKAAARVRRNCQGVGARPDEFDVICCDAASLVSRDKVAGAPFDLVFLDPPYALAAEDVEALVNDARSHGHLGEHSVVVYERAAEAPGIAPAGFFLAKTRRYGITCVDLLKADREEGCADSSRIGASNGHDSGRTLEK